LFFILGTKLSLFYILTCKFPSFTTQASSTALYMPAPENAVAHGDASLAVNDFLARTS
jgi:hypothetical protein